MRCHLSSIRWKPPGLHIQNHPCSILLIYSKHMSRARPSGSCEDRAPKGGDSPTVMTSMVWLQVPVMAGLPDAVLVTFQGCGHLAPFQQPGKFVALVDSFLGAQGSFQSEAASAYTCQGLGLPDKTTR